MKNVWPCRKRLSCLSDAILELALFVEVTIVEVDDAQFNSPAVDAVCVELEAGLPKFDASKVFEKNGMGTALIALRLVTI